MRERLRNTVVLFCLLLAGCAPALSREFTSQADKTVTFSMVQASPDVFAGKQIILGGIIDQVVDTGSGSLIYVIEKPLDYWEKPRRTRLTGGLFIALLPRRLDPLVFAPGREITIGAEVIGTRPATLPADTPDYPLVKVIEMKLWEQERQSWSQPKWVDPLYNPGERQER